MRAFLYGTLRDAALRRIVLGEETAVEPAVLAGHAVRTARGGDWPTLVAGPGAAAEGVLTAPLSAEALRRFDWYEAAFGYRAETVEVGGTPALLYRADEAASGEAWNLAEWQARWAPPARIAAAETMALYPEREPGWIGARWPQIGQRSASAARARASEPPVAVRSGLGLGAGDVEVLAERRPYTDYFALVERDLRFRRFDGGMSPTVTRAAFVAGDAATVLPYDPARDEVLVIEQFRFGPCLRGDRVPWVLEPIAGRIDAGETPEEAVRREAHEEAGLELGRLELVAAHYVSPGAVTEYLFSYVGLCDLGARHGTTGGSEDEAEDILSHVLPFGRLMEIVATGEAENGPLLLTAWWLAAHRERLRQG